jgi:DNA/RNA-binding domain of Phe-tRNA-synthetase-like protein
MKASISELVSEFHPDLRFAVAYGQLETGAFTSNLDQVTRGFREVITVREQQILDAISSFESFFDSMGYKFPLRGQFTSVKKKGLPPVPSLVKSLLYAEMTTGVLMGVQDGGKIEGNLVLDLVQGNESFVGMRSTVNCQDGEIVVRDDAGIVASLFQGPDQRTQVDPDTRLAVFYVFSSPTLSAETFRLAIDTVASVFPGGAEVRICDH